MFVEEPLHSFVGLTTALFFAHIFSAVYELKGDPNRWEWGDLAQREVGILLASAAWWWLL
jgi:hypothetical protein